MVLEEEIKALNEARTILYESLESYLKACAELEDRSSVSPAASQFLSDEISTVNTGRYENIIQQAKAPLSRVTGHNPSVSINRLPPEILARIFTSTETCCMPSLLTANWSLPSQIHWYPLALSQVCSQWRNIAISLHSLWSHIDIVPSPRGCNLLMSIQYLTFRANSVALDIHVEEHPAWEHPKGYGDELARFFKSLAYRVRSLELRCSYGGLEYGQSLEVFLVNAAPETLRRLVLIDMGAYSNTCTFFALIGFDFSTTDPSIGRYAVQELDMTLQEFENLLLPLTTLKLAGIYPYWTSQVYYRLTELHLMDARSSNAGSVDRNTIISDIRLANILRASPELRAFHFGLSVSVMSKSPPPTYMKDLEVLRLEYMDNDEQQAVLRLIDPGQNQLHMICGVELYFGTLPLYDRNHFSRFFLRSCITRLSIKGTMSEFYILRLLVLLPRLQLLGLSQFIINFRGEFEEHSSLNSQSITQTPLPSLQRLHFLRCDIYRGSIQLLIETVSIQRLTSSHCQYYFEDLDHIKSSVEQIDSEGGFGEGGWDELP